VAVVQAEVALQAVAAVVANVAATAVVVAAATAIITKGAAMVVAMAVGAAATARAVVGATIIGTTITTVGTIMITATMAMVTAETVPMTRELSMEPLVTAETVPMTRELSMEPMLPETTVKSAGHSNNTSNESSRGVTGDDRIVRQRADQQQSTPQQQHNGNRGGQAGSAFGRDTFISRSNTDSAASVPSSFVEINNDENTESDDSSDEESFIDLDFDQLTISAPRFEGPDQRDPHIFTIAHTQITAKNLFGNYTMNALHSQLLEFGSQSTRIVLVDTG